MGTTLVSGVAMVSQLTLVSVVSQAGASGVWGAYGVRRAYCVGPHYFTERNGPDNLTISRNGTDWPGPNCVSIPSNALIKSKAVNLF